MQETLRALVLRTVRYKDTRQIVDLYTLTHGRMACVAPVSHSRKSQRSGTAGAAWRLLNIVEIEADIRPSTNLPFVRSARICQPWNTLTTDPVKGTISLFLAELLLNALREQHAEPLLFQYIEESLRWLDTAERGYANFHLVFMMRLMQFVGIRPDVSRGREGYVFNLETGEYQPATSIGSALLPPEEARLLPLLLRMNYANMHCFRFSRAQRRRMLEVMNRYYSLQLPPFPALRSVDVLAEVFDA